MFNATFPPTKKLVYCALLVAVATLLSGLGSIPVFLFGAYNLKIGFSLLPVFIAAIFFGPLWGGAVGALADFTQAMVFPRGAYIPWFTLSGALFGFIPGLFFLREIKIRFFRLLLALATTQAVTSVLVNTAIMVLVIGQPWQIIYARAVTQTVMIPLHTFACFSLIKALQAAKAIPRTP